MVVELATQGGSSPLDLRLQYLHQMQANHEVSSWETFCLPGELRLSPGLLVTWVFGYTGRWLCPHVGIVGSVSPVSGHTLPLPPWTELCPPPQPHSPPWPEGMLGSPLPSWGGSEPWSHLQALLREVQALRDRLCTEDEAGSRATAERLLQLYSQLRSPSLLLL